MLGHNNIFSFSFDNGQTNLIFDRMSASKEGVLVAACITDYMYIKTLLKESSHTKLINEVQGIIHKFFSSTDLSDQSCEVFFRPPYFFVITSLSNDIKEKLLKLDHILNMHVYLTYDLQFTLSYSKFENKKSFDKCLKNIINTLEYNQKLTGYIECNDDIDKLLMYEYSILSNLKSSIKGKLTRFAYQPIIDCIGGQIAYYECLLRIPNQDGELVSAGESILLAEKYNMIHYIDMAAIEMACRELSDAPDLTLSVNVSNIGLMNESLIALIKSLLIDSDVASRLIIEITETAVNNDFEKTARFVDIIQGYGAKIAIDDFGAGSSSFAQLKHINFDILKIDGSLIKDIANNPYNRFLVDMLVKIAAEVGAKTVAEYVQDGSIAKFLLDSKVDYMQGNFFAPAQNFRSWSKK